MNVKEAQKQYAAYLRHRERIKQITREFDVAESEIRLAIVREAYLPNDPNQDVEQLCAYYDTRTKGRPSSEISALRTARLTLNNEAAALTKEASKLKENLTSWLQSAAKSRHGELKNLRETLLKKAALAIAPFCDDEPTALEHAAELPAVTNIEARMRACCFSSLDFSAGGVIAELLQNLK